MRTVHEAATLSPRAAPGADLTETRVLDNREVAPGTFLLRCARRADFQPGQVLGATTERAIAPRLYSIASGVDDDFFELLFDIVPNGLLTPRLARLAAGDRLFLSAPSGAFLDGDEPGAWLASGTGIAPFVSMARSGLAGNKLLVHGARGQSYFFFYDYLAQLMQERYLRCSSRDRAEGLYPGRLTAWVEAQAELPRTWRYLLCGSAEMVVEVRDLLLGRGLPFSSISGEIYF